MAFGIGEAIGLGQLALGGAGLLFGQDSADTRAQEILQASRPVSVRSPLGRFTVGDDGDLRLGLSRRQVGSLRNLQGLEGQLFGLLNDPDFVQSEVDRLRGIARPREDALRAQLRSQLFNRGRLGLGIGGGRTGEFFNPELAALEEAFAAEDTARVQAARGEQQRLLGNVFGLLGAQEDIRRQPLAAAQVGIAGRPSQAGLQGLGFAQARASNSIDAFFTSAAQSLGVLGPRIFRSPGGAPQQIPVSGLGVM